MLLCDIGNTTYNFLEINSNNSLDFNYKKSVNTFSPTDIKQKVYYICVNEKVKNRLENLDNWIDLSLKINIDNYYDTMGIDRIMACEAVKNGVIVDAGSAITVDVVRDGVFSGGFIYPGVSAMNNTYKNISPALSFEFNYSLNLDIIPKNSKDAISYGYLKLLYNEVSSYAMDIILTGGDADRFLKIFPHARVEKELIFNGMKKIIKKADIC